MINLVHLTASPFFGGPERQQLALGHALAGKCRSVYVSFSEGGRCRPFLDQASRAGFETFELERNAPQFRLAIQEVTQLLRRLQPDVVCCHGYKPDLLGWRACRRAGFPVFSVSRGWTAATAKVMLYEALQKVCLRFMDGVICVSEAQAAKVRRLGLAANRVHVIRNAIDIDRFAESQPDYRDKIQELFAGSPRFVVGAAGRLSPEKGFDQLIHAAALVVKQEPNAGFLIFGDGPLKNELQNLITAMGLEKNFVLAGFKKDLDQWIAALDLFASSSFTEGLPNVILEAFAARVPVVATAVGGTPEVVEENVNGYLVPSGDPPALARPIVELLHNEDRRRQMGQLGYERIKREFTFDAQAKLYLELFGSLLGRSRLPNGTSCAEDSDPARQAGSTAKELSYDSPLGRSRLPNGTSCAEDSDPARQAGSTAGPGDCLAGRSRLPNGTSCAEDSDPARQAGSTAKELSFE